MSIKLAEDTINTEDIDELRDWLGTYPRLTKGPLTEAYEFKWSSYLGVPYSTFVNSGSSANLLMLATLIEAGKLTAGDKVIVPSLSWATDVAPIMQLGLVPLLCDCNLRDYSVDIEEFKELLVDAKAAIVVPVLGLVPDMKTIVEVCKAANVILLEDCCEALGSEYKGQKLGTFGEMSTFSTYFGHHMSTIEGGMVCTANPEYDKILKSIRNHGWDRDWDTQTQQAERERWDVSDFDSLYTFYFPGFNVRATDLQAFLGLKQLGKVEIFNRIRNRNFKTYLECFELPPPSPESFISNFAYPIVSDNRDKIVKVLQENNVEVRPMICGSMGTQPFYVKKYGKKHLPNSEFLKTRGMYLPNHASLTKEDITFIVSLIKDLL